jgi:hypothetical protein
MAAFSNPLGSKSARADSDSRMAVSRDFSKLLDVIANQIRFRKSAVAKAFQKKGPVPTGTFVADFLG